MADITISHSRADGTLIADSVKGDGVWEIVRSHGFRSFRSIGALGIPRSRDEDADSWRINNAKTALEAAGHTVTLEIDNDRTRSFAEAEAERLERAGDRAERYEGYAENASASSSARLDAAHKRSERFEFGQSILVGHHSEGRARRDAAYIDNNMRKGFDEADRAKHWQGRAVSAANYEQFRYNPQRTLRRLERLRADLRQQERHHAEAVEKGYSSVDRHAREIAALREEIELWEAVVEKAKANGVKLWGPDDFVPGDYVMYANSWYQVARVNPKTLSIAWNLRLAPKQVMTLEDATDNGRAWTHPADYTNVQARCPEEAMHAFLADGKVPGTKSAGEASAAAPAAAIREEQAKRPKRPKRRSDPKVPKKVKVECPWDATEATLTWLNGRGEPHPDHPAETIHAPEGEKFTEAAQSRAVLSQVTAKVKERGLAYRGRWSGGPRSLACAVAPDPELEKAEEPALFPAAGV
ncbi:DUF3560 domain-containing protein [Streptomyces sp. NBC_00120]|uniref:DUF3560 domain-containing protein n=1 Tax=Streptomyces sp. NBC_00120 TaxID=2975660 RepID=UPI00225A103D|nr:DUF3560 domain-containing protein [Streptomyces sp. NBC_00120]MCX5326314.1 DUF3560 domain-containing protein [Streptomyces sp. NBC_00120]